MDTAGLCVLLISHNLCQETWCKYSLRLQLTYFKRAWSFSSIKFELFYFVGVAVVSWHFCLIIYVYLTVYVHVCVCVLYYYCYLSFDFCFHHLFSDVFKNSFPVTAIIKWLSILTAIFFFYWFITTGIIELQHFSYYS